jgi:hypothetical protein
MTWSGACRLSANRVFSRFLSGRIGERIDALDPAECEQLDLADACLNNRARLLMQRLLADPIASVPKAMPGFGETMAAHRFFDNENVDWHALLEPHWWHTQKRMEAHRVVLCLQDTMEPQFNGQGAFGLRPLSYGSLSL